MVPGDGKHSCSRGSRASRSRSSSGTAIATHQAFLDGYEAGAGREHQEGEEEEEEDEEEETGPEAVLYSPGGSLGGFWGPVQLAESIAEAGLGLAVTEDVHPGALLLACPPLAIMRAGSDGGSTGNLPDSNAFAAQLSGSRVSGNVADWLTALYCGCGSASSGSELCKATPRAALVRRLLAREQQQAGSGGAPAATAGGEQTRPCPLAFQQLQQVVNFYSYSQLGEDVGVASLRRATSHDDGAHTPFIGLWPSFSLINHSCAANCTYMVVDGLMTVRAARPIAAGEQLSVNYFGGRVLTPLQSRQQYLFQHYGFICRCPRCTMESKLPNDSTVIIEGCHNTAGLMPQVVREAVECGEIEVVGQVQQLMQHYIGQTEDVAWSRDATVDELRWLQASVYGCFSILRSIHHLRNGTATEQESASLPLGAILGGGSSGGAGSRPAGGAAQAAAAAAAAAPAHVPRSSLGGDEDGSKEGFGGDVDSSSSSSSLANAHGSAVASASSQATAASTARDRIAGFKISSSAGSLDLDDDDAAGAAGVSGSGAAAGSPTVAAAAARERHGATLASMSDLSDTESTAWEEGYASSAEVLGPGAGDVWPAAFPEDRFGSGDALLPLDARADGEHTPSLSTALSLAARPQTSHPRERRGGRDLGMDTALAVAMGDGAAGLDVVDGSDTHGPSAPAGLHAGFPQELLPQGPRLARADGSPAPPPSLGGPTGSSGQPPDWEHLLQESLEVLDAVAPGSDLAVQLALEAEELARRRHSPGSDELNAAEVACYDVLSKRYGLVTLGTYRRLCAAYREHWGRGSA